MRWALTLNLCCLRHRSTICLTSVLISHHISSEGASSFPTSQSLLCSEEFLIIKRKFGKVIVRNGNFKSDFDSLSIKRRHIFSVFLSHFGEFTTEILKTICSTLMHEVISVGKTEFSLNTENKQSTGWRGYLPTIIWNKRLLYFEVVMRTPNSNTNQPLA